MPRRATDLSEDRRQKLVAELRVYMELEARATLDKYVHVARALTAGMSVTEIAQVMDVTRDTVYRWKEAGERERKQREPDPR